MNKVIASKRLLVEAGAAVSGASERPLVEWGDRAAAGESSGR